MKNKTLYLQDKIRNNIGETAAQWLEFAVSQNGNLNIPSKMADKRKYYQEYAEIAIQTHYLIFRVKPAVNIGR